jgi:hypothetical protein
MTRLHGLTFRNLDAQYVQSYKCSLMFMQNFV